jgi:effector-binding domain-containing protein
MSAPLPYEVRTETAVPRVLAAVQAATNRNRLSADIVRLLDLVWPVLREQGVRTGHNVVVCYAGTGHAFTIEAGVETLTDFADRGPVRHVATPAGEVATTAHYGEYSEIAPAYAASRP